MFSDLFLISTSLYFLDLGVLSNYYFHTYYNLFLLFGWILDYRNNSKARKGMDCSEAPELLPTHLEQAFNVLSNFKVFTKTFDLSVEYWLLETERDIGEQIPQHVKWHLTAKNMKW